ncbi:MAG: hypothetical protein PHS02_04635 [Candidatus ainarchaeum sp.]|nr:hypothetical protein [Candidatus ainarchaeum sp.]
MNKYALAPAVFLFALLAFAWMWISNDVYKVMQKTMGTNLTWIGEDLKPHYGRVTAESIVDFTVSDCGLYENGTHLDRECYRVGVGRWDIRMSDRKVSRDIFWHIFYDMGTLEQIRIEQLFVT